MTYTISKHAQQRYAERIMDKDSKTDIAGFINVHAEKISTDINKMIEFGTKIFSGTLENQGSNYDVYIHDTWIVLADTKSQKVVTLYAIDLGVGDEFNQNYICLLLERLNNAQKAYEDKSKELTERVNEWEEQIRENKEKIKELRQTANALEQANENLEAVIADYSTQKYVAGQEVREIVRTLIGKKIV